MSDAMTPEREAEIRQRYEASTPGADLVRYEHGGGRLGVWESAGQRDLVADFYKEADREFYYHARADIDTLLHELARLRALAAAPPPISARELEKALEFYADKEHWIYRKAREHDMIRVGQGSIDFEAPGGMALPAALIDHGTIARAALPDMRDATRCPICGWPYAESRDKGCVPGDCSYRPDPQASPEEYARVQRNRARLAAGGRVMSERSAAEVIAEWIAAGWGRKPIDTDRADGERLNAALETAANLPAGSLDGLIRGTHVVVENNTGLQKQKREAIAARYSPIDEEEEGGSPMTKDDVIVRLARLIECWAAMTPSELIAALERAELGSRELDCAIARFVGWKFAPPYWHPPGDNILELEPPPFSTSIDAALRLVNPDHWLEIGHRRGDNGERVNFVGLQFGESPYFAGAYGVATFPLGICIVALKAEAALKAGARGAG